MLIPLVLRKKLKQYSLFQNLNKIYKSYDMIYKNKALDFFYAKKAGKLGLAPDSKISIDLFNQKIAKRKIKLPLKKKGELKIFYFGACEPQDRSGFLQGLEKFGKVYLYQNIQGGYGPLYWQYNLDLEVREKNAYALIESINNAENDGVPVDLIIGQMWADYLPVSVLKMYQEQGKIIINIAMDDRGVPDFWFKNSGITMGGVGLSSGTDIVLNTSYECCIRYLLEKTACDYWPLASDPDIFKPAKVKDIDVSFIGSCYGIRKEYVEILKNRGVDIKVFGPGWEGSRSMNQDECADIFSRSKIILGIGTVAYSQKIKTMKLRDFDAPMSGAVYVTSRNPDLYNFFKEDKEIVFYDSPEEAAEKIKKLLIAKDVLENIGHQARERSLKEHTWEKRIGDTLKNYGII